MSIAICAFNSAEMNDLELIKDELHLFVKERLSDRFSDLILQRDMMQPQPELDQLGRILGVDVEPLYDMSHYWDKSAEQKRLSELPTEQDRIKQIAIILELNARVIGNAEVVHRTLHALEQGLAAVPEPWRLLQNANDGFFDARSYFSRDTSYEGFHVDLKVMTDFLAFVQPLGADTIHFKFL